MRLTIFLLKVFYTNQPRRKEAEEFVTATETICDLGYEIQKVSRMYLDTTISALNNSNLDQADQLAALLKDIRKSNKLSTNHEVALIDCAVSVASGANKIKHMYHFKHPAAEKCNKAGRCGFIVETVDYSEIRQTAAGRCGGLQGSWRTFS